MPPVARDSRKERQIAEIERHVRAELPDRVRAIVDRELPEAALRPPPARTRESTRRKLSRKSKAAWARARRLAEIEGIPVGEARKRMKGTIVDTVLEPATDRVYLSYIEDPRRRGTWYAIDPDMPRKMRYRDKSKSYTTKDILRKVKRERYESAVKSIMTMTGMTYRETQGFLRGFESWSDGLYYASKKAGVRFAPKKQKGYKRKWSR
jgi:hypothetical protein